MRLRLDLHWQILIALLLGVGAGLLWPLDPSPAAGLQPADAFDFVGQLFLRGLRMVIVPLVAASIITGVAGVGSGRGLGRLFARTFGLYVATSLMAILTGLLLVNLVRPGVDAQGPVAGRLGLSAPPADLAAKLEGRGAADIVGIVQRMVPENVLAAASAGDMLALIFFCIILGLGITTLPANLRERQIEFWDGLNGAMLKVTGWVMATAPLGIFALVARLTASSGFEAFGPLARYGLVVLGALAIHGALTLPLMVTVLGRLPAWRHVRAVAPALLTAFSTRSSSAALPLSMECVEKRAGVSNRVTSFVLPLGATVNMNGTALYECVAAMFIAQAYGIELGFATQFAVVLTALLASIGAAGIPAAGLVMMSIVLDAAGLPLEGIALILAIDPVLDMCRTAINVFGDTCVAVVVARAEGETGVLTR
ncbi:MAG: dicarboxylate/amino acid:cation symporter [bacterium]|nr:dicarboxylate/amino acid:cation symporter [bacterium]